MNIIKLWVKTVYLQGKRIGNRLLIPHTEIERLSGDERAHVIHAIGHGHDESSGLGREGGMTPEELWLLEEGQWGKLPWEE